MKRLIYLIIGPAIVMSLIASCMPKESVKVSTIEVTPATLTLYEGETFQMTAKVSPSDAEYTGIFWHSEDDGVALVSKDGLVTAIKKSESPIRIIASGGMKAGYCELTVTTPYYSVTGLDLGKAPDKLYVGDSWQIVPVITPANATNKNVKFTSTDTNVATVDKATGLVKILAPGTVKIVGVTEDSMIESEVTITIVEGGAEGLCQRGTSNSYIVTKAGRYFILPVKGNSQETINDISSVEVLWETVNTTTAPAAGTVVSGLSYEDGRLFFDAQNVPGNAVIAAKGSDGTILWSWHIWNVLSEVSEVTHSNGTVVLDRNIGALSATGDLSAGFMFQWGRKDPFLGADKPSSGGTVIKATAGLNNDAAVATSETVGTVEYTIANPTKYIQPSGASAWDWYYKKMNDTLWNIEKTIYDPCPVGYKVPSKSAWDGLSKIDYPLSGRLNAAGKGWQAGPGTGCSYWSCDTPGKGGTTVHLLVISKTDGTCSVGSTTRGIGCPVRCVKE